MPAEAIGRRRPRLLLYPRLAWLVACAGLLMVVSVSTKPASSGNEGPVARGVWRCWADSPSHKARLWWNEVRGSEHTIPNVFETASAPEYTPPRTDGRCATHPEVVRYLARRIATMLRRDRVLGLPSAASDSGMPATWGDPSRPDSRIVDGRSPAIDVYLDAGSSLSGGGEEGVAECVRWSPPGRRSARSAAFVTLYGVRTFNQAELNRVVFNAAHELVHVSQCAVTNRTGSVNGTMLDIWMVEGSADAFALASSGLFDERHLALALRNPESVLVPRSRPAEPTMYAQFPFWYELFKAPSARRYAAYLRRAVAASPVEHRRGDVNLVYRTFGETAVQRALSRFASFAVFGGDLGGAHYDPARLVLEEPASLARLKLSNTAPAGTRVRLGSGRYGYIVLTWPEGATDLTVSAAGAPAARAAESIAVGTRENGLVSRARGAWNVHRDCDAVGRCNLYGPAYISIANGRRSSLTIALTITAK